MRAAGFGVTGILTAAVGASRFRRCHCLAARAMRGQGLADTRGNQAQAKQQVLDKSSPHEPSLQQPGNPRVKARWAV